MGNEKPSGFAARLRLLRESAGLTQTQLAERAGLHKLGVAKLEQGLREPAWATVQALARSLGVTCAAFEFKDDTEIVEGSRPMGRPRKQPTTPADAPKRRPGRPRKASSDASGASVDEAAADAPQAKAGPAKAKRPKK